MRSLTPEELEEIRMISDRPRAEREERLPDEDAAIQAIIDGYGRLVEFGWKPVADIADDGSYLGIVHGKDSAVFCRFVDPGRWGHWEVWHADEEDGESIWPVLVKEIEETAP